MPWEAWEKASARIKPAVLSAKPSMTACIHLYTRQRAILQEALVIPRLPRYLLPPRYSPCVPEWSQASRIIRSAISTTLLSSIARVMGPTPPGLGV